MLATLLAVFVVPADFRIVLGGDIMLNGVSPKTRPLAALTPLFRSADLSLANLEVPLASVGRPTPRKSPAEIKRRDQFVLRADPAHVEEIAASGIGLVSLANNHAMDYGDAGLQQELSLLDARSIAHAGAGLDAQAAMAPAVVTLANGRRVALLSALAFVGAPALRKTTPATQTAPGVAVLSFGGRIDARAKAKLKRWIGTARSVSDFVVVALHWGTERKPAPNAYQVALGHAVVEGGADLVWGHHPHVLQGYEWYRGVPILYSMGNLVSPTPATSALVQFSVKDRRVTSVAFRGVAIARGRATPLTGSANANLGRLVDNLSRRIPSRFTKETDRYALDYGR